MTGSQPAVAKPGAEICAAALGRAVAAWSSRVVAALLCTCQPPLIVASLAERAGAAGASGAAGAAGARAALGARGAVLMAGTLCAEGPLTWAIATLPPEASTECGHPARPNARPRIRG